MELNKWMMKTSPNRLTNFQINQEETQLSLNHRTMVQKNHLGKKKKTNKASISHKNQKNNRRKSLPRL